MAELFDADADGDLDLYVGLAGNEFWGKSDALRDRLYLGDGQGGFVPAPAGALPDVFTQTGTVAAGDVDGDGDTDLFVGGRVVAREYGQPAQSALLLNDGRGRFTDASARWLPDGGTPRHGLRRRLGGCRRRRPARPRARRRVDGADRAPQHRPASLAPLDIGLGESTGWWTALAAADLDGDGDVDLALGNLGLNSLVRASPEHPARLWLGGLRRE